MLKKGKIGLKCLNGVFEDRASTKYNPPTKKKDRKLLKGLSSMVKSQHMKMLFVLLTWVDFNIQLYFC